MRICQIVSEGASYFYNETRRITKACIIVGAPSIFVTIYGAHNFLQSAKNGVTPLFSRATIISAGLAFSLSTVVYSIATNYFQKPKNN